MLATVVVLIIWPPLKRNKNTNGDFCRVRCVRTWKAIGFCVSARPLSVATTTQILIARSQSTYTPPWVLLASKKQLGPIRIRGKAVHCRLGTAMYRSRSSVVSPCTPSYSFKGAFCGLNQAASKQTHLSTPAALSSKLHSSIPPKAWVEVL